MGIQTALNFDNGLNFFMPLVKVDKEKRLVTGVATSEMRDSDGEVIDYEASKAAFKKWLGNIREMHDPKKAVGKRVEIVTDDKEKKIYVTSHISKGAPETWEKIMDGTLTGYSVGGKVILKEVEKDDPATKRIKEFSMSELSVVDAPANPECVMGLVKSVGGELRFVEPDVEETLIDQIKKFKERRKRQMTEKDALKKAEKEECDKEEARKEEARKEEARKEEARKEEAKKEDAKKEDAKKAEDGGGSVEDRVAKLEATVSSLVEAIKELIATDEQAHEDMEGKEDEVKEDAKVGEEDDEEAEEAEEEAEEEDDEEKKKAAGSNDDLKKSVADLKAQNSQLAKALKDLNENVKSLAKRPLMRKFVQEKEFASDKTEQMKKSDQAASEKATEPIPPEIQAIIEKSKSGTATPAELRQKDEYLTKRMSARFPGQQ